MNINNMYFFETITKEILNEIRNEIKEESTKPVFFARANVGEFATVNIDICLVSGGKFASLTLRDPTEMKRLAALLTATADAQLSQLYHESKQ